MMRPVVVALFAALLLPARAHAKATFIVQARGGGFSDRTPVAPQGGNVASTLGEQRRAAVQHAADLWGERLDSAVPVSLDVVFQELGCEETSAVLAAAGAVSLFSGMSTPEADPSLWYPSALANRLTGRDLAPSEPDIEVLINLSVDDECRDQFGGFYYGLDAQAGERVDLVAVILHELAHGLGFSSFVDLDSGSPEEGGVDVFSAHIFDLEARKTWRELGNEERRASGLAVRGLAFRGTRTMLAARELLAKGAPTLTLDRALPGFVGAVSDGASYATIDGPVRLAGSFEGCAATSIDLMGALVLVRPDCPSSQWEPRLLAAGARGVLLALPSGFAQPALALPSSGRMSALPTMTVSTDDADRMRGALEEGPLRARMHWDPSRLVGADHEGRPLLFASQPADEGSSVSHFEPLARPDLLMEPFMGLGARHAVDLTWPVMMDLGWEPFCGNRRIDADEQCDEGDANSDHTPNACRLRCVLPRCGDGVIDTGEACDQGRANSDVTPNACRARCVAARCGDGVRDEGEACDEGAQNSEQRPDACRPDCRRASCGDGVIDEGEACDGARDCSDRCTRIAGERELGWVDPWDAPRDHEARPRRQPSGCVLAAEGEPPLGAGSVLLLGWLALRGGRKRLHVHGGRP